MMPVTDRRQFADAMARAAPAGPWEPPARRVATGVATGMVSGRGRRLGHVLALILGLLCLVLVGAPALAQAAASPPAVVAGAGAVSAPGADALSGLGADAPSALGADAPSALGGLIALATGAEDETPQLSLSLQLLLLITLVTLLPSVLLMMTAFVRIIVVLAILRQALGLQQAPPNQLLIGLALFLTFFVMQPSLGRINEVALQPFVADTMSAEQAILATGDELHRFMIANTREADLMLFSELAGAGPYAGSADVPMRVLMPAFATSELKTAFQIGILLFLPFLIIDLLVATVLMALGMMMVSPIMIALPFKLMLFVAVDGWALVMASLADSFAGG